MPAAVIAPIVGGALAAGGAVIASSNNSKAINKSTDASLQAQRESIAAQTAALDKQLGLQTQALNQGASLQANAFNASGKLQTDLYNNNLQLFTPNVQQGYGATNQIDALLGIPGVGNPKLPGKIAFTPVEAQTITAPPPSTSIPAYANGTWWHPGGQALVGENGPEVVNLPQGAQVLPNAFGNWRRAIKNGQAPANTNTPATATPASTSTVSPQNQALNAFYNTQFYQFPLQQGLNAINANYAARGSLESGAAQKALEKYASGVAWGGFGDYLQALGSQQALGANAASNIAGIGSNYANSLAGLTGGYTNALTGLNSNYAANVGNAYGNYGNAQSQYAQNVGNLYGNQAVANANNTNGLINGLGNGIGYALGSIPFGSGNAYSSLSPYVSANIAANPAIF